MCIYFFIRHDQRSKAMMRDTITMAIPGPTAPQTAAEPLSAPRTLLQRPEQPDRPLQLRLPADASGLAATIRGPLAPELYALIVARASASSSSSSASATPSTSVTPSTSAGATSAGATSAPSTATTAPSASSSAPAGAVPRSTAWRWKVQQEKERRAREEGRDLKDYNKASHFTCRLCGQPKTRENGHSVCVCIYIYICKYLLMNTFSFLKTN